MKVTLLQKTLCILMSCVGIQPLMGMETSPYSLTNTGKIAFTAIILGSMKKELVSNQTWKIYDNPRDISVEVVLGCKKLSATFTPSGEHTLIKVSESPQDKAPCIIINRTDAQLLIEQETPPQPSTRIRPQTAPAHSFHFQQ